MERTLSDAGTIEELTRRTRGTSERLFASRRSRLGEEFAGPVMVEGGAAGEFLSQTLAVLLVASRPPESDGGGRGGQQAQGQAPPLLNRIGLRVLPDPFSVSDTPSLKAFAGRPVPGAYEVDHEGVPARDVSLVEKGRLMTLLTSRTPQRNLLRSNGHGRSNSVQPGVVQLTSAQAIPAAQMKARYLALLKLQERPFGYIVRGISDGPRQPGGGPGITEIVRVEADGTETPVRGLRFGSVPPTAFRDIAEASEERTVFNFRTGYTTIASVIAPNLIFEELEIQRTRDVAQRPPVVRSPLQPN
jgi:predicted Zn-dependent protease